MSRNKMEIMENENVNLKIIGLNIAAERKRKALNQEQLAELIGTTRHTISLAELGKQNLSVSKFLAIAKALGVSLDELVKNTQ